MAGMQVLDLKNNPPPITLLSRKVVVNNGILLTNKKNSVFSTVICRLRLSVLKAFEECQLFLIC